MRERGTDTKRQTSGSETRQRGRLLQVRLTEAERSRIEADATARRLTAPSYARAVLLGEEAPRSIRKPPPDAAELARLLGQLGKIGSNLNQLAHLGNQGQFVPPPELNACLGEVRAAVGRLAEVLHDDY
jgi:hypothetical protein